MQPTTKKVSGDLILDEFVPMQNLIKEYECIWTYDLSIFEKEIDNRKVLFYNACGVPKDQITYEAEFVNKTGEMFLNIKGEVEFPKIGFKRKLDIHLPVDTHIYDGYEVDVFDGIVAVALHEIEREKPKFVDFSATKCEEEDEQK